MELINQTVIINPVKRKPVPVRSLADKIADPKTLMLPFTNAEVQQLLNEYSIYEHLNNTCFPDFGAFISHIVAEGLRSERS
mgnify:CR=1 FL=1